MEPAGKSRTRQFPELETIKENRTTESPGLWAGYPVENFFREKGR
jgi:hypothetical protein